MNTKNLAYIALFTAVIAVTAWIHFPLGGIPFTLQTLGICLTAGLLGWKRGLIVGYDQSCSCRIVDCKNSKIYKTLDRHMRVE